MKSKESRIDFEKLGINNTCLRSGENNNLSKCSRINSNNFMCKSRKSTGHVQKVCIKTFINAKRSHSPNISNNKIKTFENTSIKMIVDIYDNHISDSAADAKKYILLQSKLKIAIKMILSNCYHIMLTEEQDTLLPRIHLKNENIMKQFEPTNLLYHTLKMYSNLSRWKNSSEG